VRIKPWNVAAHSPGARRGARVLEQWKVAHYRPVPTQDTLTEQDIAKLRSLGYVK